MRGQSVPMINFAEILIGSKCLGSGSFSKVFIGSYRMKDCAVKLIYSSDLTEGTIKKLVAEASILSSIKHKNVVNILGVSVFPPCICLVLEYCLFGSLSDIIHGYGYVWSHSSEMPYSISHVDRINLALGCARGLAAVHSVNISMCHRDVKSFNFLVDGHLNVKIADLELGTNMDEFIDVDDILVNWLAPEVIQGGAYRQSADVYSLSIVLWEIFSGKYPFDDDMRENIVEKLRNGFRHSIPRQIQSTSLESLIERAWSDDPSQRPSSQNIADELEVIMQDVCYKHVSSTHTSDEILDQIIAYRDSQTANAPYACPRLTHQTISPTRASVMVRFSNFISNLSSKNCADDEVDPIAAFSPMASSMAKSHNSQHIDELMSAIQVCLSYISFGQL